jgi:FkbM family methyltransferase
VHLAFQLDQAEFAKFAHTYCIAPTMLDGLTGFRERGFEPATIVDVGAHEGGWTAIASRVWPKAKPILIEPNREKFKKLQRMGEVRCELLGAKTGQCVTFNLMETGSSVFEENSTVARITEKRQLSTLDSLGLPVRAPALLKIDAQGYELEILKGAPLSIPLFEAILLEVALIQVNRGAPLLDEVIAFMAQSGFVASEVLELHRRPLDGALSQIDVLFLKRGSAMMADTRFMKA